ncbi:hyalin-like isoform X2 [Patiria miniata]|nr:hyalin-like isoform X2 [Patiria miniata]
MLYWTDASLAHIGRARMDGTGSKEIFFSESHYSPKGIVINLVHRYIFWSDIGDNPRIERADLDGRNRTIIVEGGLNWPSSVTIDLAGNSLYWIDAGHDIIETSDISGNNRRIVANLTVHSVTYPFDLAVYADYVYWTGWLMSPTLLRAHLDGRDEETFGPSVFQMPGGIHIQEVEADTTPPVVSGCPTAAIEATVPLGTTATTVTWTPPTATDGPGVLVTTSSNYSPGHRFNLGMTTVRYTFADVAGNQAFCDFVVSVIAIDSINPTISCQADIVRYVRSSSQNVTVSWPSPTATDDSGVQPSVTSNPDYPTPSGSFGVGQHTITYTARDEARNEASCTVTINIVVDTQAPTITGCHRTTAVLQPGSSSVAVWWTEPIAMDDNGVVNTTQTHEPGDMFTEGHTQVTYTFADLAGNRASCTFNVTVSRADETDPVISCSAGIVRYVRRSSQHVTVSWPSPTATDDSGVQPTVTSTPNYPTQSGSFGVGQHSVTYTAQDAAGNEASCTVGIDITLDSQAPTITGCPNDITAVLPPGNSSVAVQWTKPVASDDNGQSNVTQNHRPGDLFTRGDTDVTYTFTDQAGNQASCTFTVTAVAGCVVTPDQLGHLEVVSGQKTVYLPGESVQFACPAGYQLSGSANRICLSDFSWSGEPAVCQPQVVDTTCTAPPTLKHVTVAEGQDHVFKPGELATFTCSDDFVVTGTDRHYAQRVCQSDGSWSSKPVECSPVDDVGKVAVGAAAGGVVCVVIFLLVFLIIRRWKKNNNRRTGRAPDIALIPSVNTYNDTHAYEIPAPVYETTIGGAAAAAGAAGATEYEVNLKVPLPPTPPPPNGPPPSYDYVPGNWPGNRPPTYMEVK